jgi:RNA polymerase sigma-70 factor (ECF subfamily)
MPSRHTPSFPHISPGGDKELFLQAYDRYAPRIFRFIFYKIGKDQSQAEELTQQAFFKTWEYLCEGAQPIQHMQAFLYQVARNLVHDFYRMQDRAPAALTEQEYAAPSAASPFGAAGAAIDPLHLDRALDAIPAQYREIILLRFMDDMSIAEISEVLHKKKDTVYVILHRALKSMRSALDTLPAPPCTVRLRLQEKVQARVTAALDRMSAESFPAS